MESQEKPVAWPIASEGKLVAGLKEGDNLAFETIIREHGGRMLSTIKRLLRDDEESSDALQDALLSAFRAIEGFAHGSQLSTWLHRIAVNAALMRLRRRRHHERSIEDLLPRFVEDGHQLEPSLPWKEWPDQEVASRDLLALVRVRIDELPEPYRSTLLLRDVEGLDTSAVAKLMDVSENNVKVRLHRARQALRALLDPTLVSCT